MGSRGTATPAGLLWVLGGQGHKLGVPSSDGKEAQGSEGGSCDIAWGTTHYLQGIVPPGVGQDGGSKNGHRRAEKGCLTGKRDQERLRLGYHSVGTVLDSKSWEPDDVG